MKDVLKELDKHPLAKYGIQKHIKNDRRDVSYLQLDQRTIFVTDLMTYIGASEEQRQLMKKLIDKYGDAVLQEVFAEIFLNSDDRSTWVDMV